MCSRTLTASLESAIRPKAPIVMYKFISTAGSWKNGCFLGSYFIKSNPWDADFGSTEQALVAYQDVSTITVVYEFMICTSL